MGGSRQMQLSLRSWGGKRRGAGRKPSGDRAGMKGLGVRLARGLNGLIGRSGRVLADRFHARILKSPREVANALRYVLGNFASHMARLGRGVAAGFVDPYSSGSFEQLVACGPAPPGESERPRPWTWLLQAGWRRGLG